MNTLIIIGIIFLCIIVITVLLIPLVKPLIVSATYGCAAGIALKNESEISAWEYWETMKRKRWSELSDEEKEKMIAANMVITGDVGIVVEKEELIKMLNDQLPIAESQCWLNYKR